MPNLTQEQVIAAIKTTVEATPGHGVALTRSRFYEEEAEVIDLITSQNPTGDPTGVLITWVDIAQEDGGGVCEVLVKLRYQFDVLFEYEDSRGDNKTSDEVFKKFLWDLNTAFNQSRDLGLGETCRHAMLQSTEEFQVIAWGEGHGHYITHHAQLSLEVEVIHAY